MTKKGISLMSGASKINSYPEKITARLKLEQAEKLFDTAINHNVSVSEIIRQMIERIDMIDMKIWTSNTFEGCWPPINAAVVIAETAIDACKYLNIELKNLGLEGVKVENVEELSQVESTAKILDIGDY